MKNKVLIASLSLAIFAISGVAYLNLNSNSTYKSRKDLGIQTGIHGAFEYYARVTSDLATGGVNPHAKLKALNALNKRNKRNQHLKAAGEPYFNKDGWIEVGPDNVGGRTRAIVVDKDNSKHVWAGSVSGGLWESFNEGITWKKVEGFSENLVISAMAQLANGQLYVGTGCDFEGVRGGNTGRIKPGTGGSSFIGNGLYVSNDGGKSFEHAYSLKISSKGDSIIQYFKPADASTSDNILSDRWVTVNELVADPVNPDLLWVAHKGGFFRYYTADKSVKYPTERTLAGIGEDISVSEDGQYALAVVNGALWLSNDAGESWTQISGGGAKINVAGGADTRIETAINQVDSTTYMYVLVSRSKVLYNGYGSKDGGETWEVLVDGSIQANNFLGGQGDYDNVVAAIPGKPGEAIMGGVTLFKVGFDFFPRQIAANFAPKFSPSYVHSDIHEFTWSDDGVLYIGTDGGIHVSYDKASTFEFSSRTYNVTQFYDIAYSPSGQVMGGTQDNGTLFMSENGITQLFAQEVMGGDGFDCAISQLNPNFMFGSSQFGNMQRSVDGGKIFSTFFDQQQMCTNPSAPCLVGPFNTSMDLHENINDLTSRDSVIFTNTSKKTFPIDTTITVKSKTEGYTIDYTFTDSLPNDSSIHIQDPISSCLAVGLANGVWFTRNALHIGTSDWINVSPMSNAEKLEFGADGSLYFVGSGSATVTQVSNLANVWDDFDGLHSSPQKVTQQRNIFTSPNGVITGIAADPNDPHHLIITIGNYNAPGHVYESFNALSENPTFSSIQGDLPDFPVYDAEVDKDNPSIIVVGTEFGVFTTQDGGITWVEDNMGLERVPVYDIEQQDWPLGKGEVTETGTYFIGTHGRGAFKALEYSENKVGIDENVAMKVSLKLFPNPVQNQLNIDIQTTNNIGEIEVSIYNITGTLVKKEMVAHFGQQIQLPVYDINPGNYIITLKGDNYNQQGKFVKL